MAMARLDRTLESSGFECILRSLVIDSCGLWAVCYDLERAILVFISLSSIFGKRNMIIGNFIFFR